MIKVSIRADKWAVSATAHNDDILNPLNGVNDDATLARALANALVHAACRLKNPLYVLAIAVERFGDWVDCSYQEVANKFAAAATEFADAVENKKSEQQP
jgi:hypothetical protein